MPRSALSWSQKAAAVLVSVGPDVAAKVLEHFDESHVEQVAVEVATLGEVDSATLEEVVHDLRTEVVAQRHLLTGGEHHAREMLRRLHGPEADDVVDRLLASVITAPFYFLRVHEPEEVVKHLSGEHPQTIALVLAHLPAKFAARVLAELPQGTQVEVARRVAVMDASVPEIVAQVEAALRERVGEVTRRRDRDGVRELATLLNQVDRTTEKTILSELERSDAELAERVRALMFVFEDISGLDDRAIQELMRAVDLKQLAVALKGVSSEVRAAFERNMSERARETLLEEIDLLGPVRLRDVEEAQNAIVQQARQLEKDGVIVMSRQGEEEFVV